MRAEVPEGVRCTSQARFLGSNCFCVVVGSGVGVDVVVDIVVGVVVDIVVGVGVVVEIVGCKK